MSPASGDSDFSGSAIVRFRAVSIQLMSPASGDYVFLISQGVQSCGFHSIDVPSEWGLAVIEFCVQDSCDYVSIQLMSPASGDTSVAQYGFSAATFPFN